MTQGVRLIEEARRIDTSAVCGLNFELSLRRQPVEHTLPSDYRLLA